MIIIYKKILSFIIYNEKTGRKFLLLVLLIIQAIFIFIRTLVYMVFDTHFLNLDRYIGIDNERTVDYVLTIFAVVRLLISGIVLYKRQFRNDILSYALIYLIFTSFVRFYYHYLIEYKNHTEIKKLIDKYQDINALGLFLVSMYILKYVFFN